MNELAELMDEATLALARMDADALGRLEVRALGLPKRMEGVAPADVTARLRVLGSVLQETGRGLSVLRRIGGAEGTWGR